MDATVLNFTEWAGYMLLIAVRVISTYMANPIFGKNVPAIAKIVLGIMISYLLLSTFDISTPLVFDTTIEYVVACVKEIILGLTFGMIIYMMLSFVYLAGNIIDVQLGFGFAQLYDPVTNVNSNISAQLLHILVTILFFVTDSHHIMIQLIADTFAKVPPGAVTLDMSFVYLIVEIFVLSMNLALRVAMPILAVVFATEMLLGVIIKSVPQVNFFIIGFPVKIIVGLIVVLIMLPIFVDFSDMVFENMFAAIQKVFEEIGA